MLILFLDLSLWLIIVAGGRVLSRRRLPALVVVSMSCVVWCPSCCGVAEASLGCRSSPLGIFLWLALFSLCRMARFLALLASAAGVRHWLPLGWSLLYLARVDFATKPVRDGVSVLPVERATSGDEWCLRL